MYYFNCQNYDYAIGDFTELLKREKDHVSARLHRARSYFYLEDYQLALTDFCATLHYDPSNWSAYYYRACLVRRCDPKQALQDYSISLLINAEYENLGSYLHRALIYCQQNQFDEAIADYEAILVLDREHAPTLCNLAIIYMKRHAQKALDLFTRAIQAEPTYVRAYFCRAYFYTQINQLQQAYSDYTKSRTCHFRMQLFNHLHVLVYHMHPDQNAAMVLRGNVLLAMGQLDSASFCVEVAAKLQSTDQHRDEKLSTPSSTMNMSTSSAQQQAIVHAFLEQYELALNIMERECVHHPTASNYRMLGTLRIKDKRYDGARDAFEKCIEICSNSGTSDHTQVMYDAYLDLSRCLIQLKSYSQAIEQLNILVKLRQASPSAEAYLQRGIAKMRMFAHVNAEHLMKLSSNSRPLLDINRALVIEPDNAEAYLARAAW
jgi:tetratricopeptide (TPR) repeat protein